MPQYTEQSLYDNPKKKKKRTELEEFMHDELNNEVRSDDYEKNGVKYSKDGRPKNVDPNRYVVDGKETTIQEMIRRKEKGSEFYDHHGDKGYYIDPKTKKYYKK
jgi:hypothetical protein